MKKLAMVLIIFVFTAVSFAGQLFIPQVFSDNMVLQRGMDIPVWGTAEAGSEITVKLGDESVTKAVKECGSWKIDLSEKCAGGPFNMTITSRDSTITFKNVMIGDVWLASGQSNMEWVVKNAKNPEQEIAAADYPNIRHIKIEKNVSGYPKNDVNTKGWQVCTPETAAEFSAVAYYFGRELHLEKDVPIGLLHTSWGGTLCEAWTSLDMLHTMPDFKKYVEKVWAEKPDYEKMDKAQAPDVEKYWDILNNAQEGLKKGAHKRNYNDSDWDTVQIPGTWETGDLKSYDGFVWCRKEIEIPKEYAKKDLVIKLGQIEQHDITYFNGEQVGIMWGGPKYRSYKIPAKLVRKGKNVIALRAQNRWGAGGIFGQHDSLAVYSGDSSAELISYLTGEWKFSATVEPQLPKIVGYQNKAASLYNAMIAPLIPYAIKGAIWYQGESNTGRAYQYRTLFPKMIEDWRVRWGQGYFPFFFVQLANFMEQNQNPEQSAWAELREAQNMTLDYPNTGQAVIIDIGEADDIHPKNKQDVGKRLALAAQKIAYGDDVVYSGPAYTTMKIVGDAIELQFDHTGSGMIAKGEKLTGFAIADSSKKFVWADAKIEGDKVICSSSEIKNPVAVRYGWANNPDCNLYNKEGLPASPFRTDSWKGVTQY